MPDLIFACEGSPYSAAISAEFRDTVAADGLSLGMETTPTTRAMAGVEWLMPTAIMLYVAKSYFDGFLGEAGKDHYAALKSGVKRVAARVGQVAVSRIGSPGKVVATPQRYSPVFSIWFQRDDQTRFKFLVPVGLSEDETEAAFERFFAFLDGWSAGRIAKADRAPFEAASAVGRTVLLAYDRSTGRIEVIDPLPRGSGQ
ncbi:hypothetical protein [Brevundimonas subvibrioides]|uniref:hypothetical protein n=1 Tax=Brevundimonas subvibrioides TaxID=74313 RepID=UPI0022B2CDCF|nr:hypothetical protein [Brevundimonas subvibrioides]